MTYPCNRCNMDEGSPICLQDERCPQRKRNAYGPVHVCPEPAPGLEFDARGVLVTKYDPWDVLGRFFKFWAGSALYDGSGVEVDLEEPYEAFRAIHAQQAAALGPNVELERIRAPQE